MPRLTSHFNNLLFYTFDMIFKVFELVHTIEFVRISHNILFLCDWWMFCQRFQMCVRVSSQIELMWIDSSDFRFSYWDAQNAEWFHWRKHLHKLFFPSLYHPYIIPNIFQIKFFSVWFAEGFFFLQLEYFQCLRLNGVRFVAFNSIHYAHLQRHGIK